MGRVEPVSFAEWALRSRARRRRRALVEDLLHLVALHVLVAVSVLQVRRVWPPGSGAADVAVVLLGVSLLGFDVLAVLSPRRMLPVAGRLVRGSVGRLIRFLTLVLLVAVHVVMLPLSRLVGRRQYLRRRPEQVAWFSSGGWRVSTWVPKSSEALLVDGRGRWRLALLLGRLRSGGGVYLVVLALLVLLALSLNAAAATPKLAPFIYTLF